MTYFMYIYELTKLNKVAHTIAAPLNRYLFYRVVVSYQAVVALRFVDGWWR